MFAIRSLVIVLVGIVAFSQAHCVRCSNQTTTARRLTASATSSSSPTITLDQLSELHVQHQRLIAALEKRADRMEIAQMDRMNTLDEQINRLTQLQAAAADRLIRREPMAGDNRPTTQNKSVDPSLANKLESLAYLLQSTRRAVHNLNITTDDALNRLFRQIDDLPGRIEAVQSRRIAAPSDVQNSLAEPATDNAAIAPIGCESVGRNASNVYAIRASPVHPKPFFVYCSMAEPRAQPAWTVVLSRTDAQTSFQRSWAEYRRGFGNVAGDHWIGLDSLHALTASRLHEVRFELADHDGQYRYARYSAFAIGDESEDYALRVLGGYAGTAGDSFAYHSGQKFSTFDEDNDSWAEGNCAQAHSGAGWFRSCDKTNIFGKYLSPNSNGTTHQGIYWDTFHGPNYSMKSVLVMIRAV